MPKPLRADGQICPSIEEVEVIDQKVNVFVLRKVVAATMTHLSEAIDNFFPPPK
jgi:hypothetical protein